MPINLSKGQKVSLTKSNPGLKNIMVGLGWDVNAFDTGADFDLDAAAFMLGSNGKCPTDQEFVFYGNLEHPTGSVKHMGITVQEREKVMMRKCRSHFRIFLVA